VLAASGSHFVITIFETSACTSGLKPHVDVSFLAILDALPPPHRSGERRANLGAHDIKLMPRTVT